MRKKKIEKKLKKTPARIRRGLLAHTT